MAHRGPREHATDRVPRDFWQAWFELWSAAGASDERARVAIAGDLAVVKRGVLNLNTLKGWIKRDPGARRKPREKEKVLEVIHELRRRAGRRPGSAARSPVMSWTDTHWLSALARPSTATANDCALDRMIETSLKAREALQPDVLPSVDRLADMAGTLGASVADILTPLAVVGEGGLGKSVLLRQIYDAQSAAAEDVVPILVLCSSISSAADLGTAASLDAALGVSATGDRGAPPLTAMVNEICARRSIMVLLDTVDLIVNDHNVDEVVHILRALAARTRLIFTCREQEYLNYLDNERGLVQTRYQLPKLTSADVESWARHYTTAENTDPLHRDAFIISLTTPAATELCATPLRLAMACDIYAQVGAIPADLTVTELYNQYWNQRIAVDRHGKGTAAARAQEITAEAIAAEMWQASTSHFVVSAAGDTIADGAALQRLCSDGVLREIGGRYQFFHQTYAEYAVARRLARTGSADDLHRLRQALEHATVAGLWPVARHIVTLEMAEDRYRIIAEAIPLSEAEGVRLHFAGAFHRRDTDRVEALGHHVDIALLSAGVTVLADAPPECLPAVSELALGCLRLSRAPTWN